MAPKRKRTSPSTGTTYQVFLSFRGPDTRQGFADFLYHALTDAGIHVFRDDEEIRKGEDIGDEILGAIGESRIFVPIFSRGYASSKWCLIELSKMFESKEASPESDKNKKILPVFYDVSIDDVKLKTELYAEALFKHRENFTPDTVQQWEEALRKAGKIKGYEVKDTGHGEFAKRLVRDISMKLKGNHKYLTERLVQRDDQVDALMKLLDIEVSGIRFVGIHGMGGIGKTTLAKVVFNKLCDHYKHCCFLADVRESCGQHKGIENLQKQLLSSLCPTLRHTMDEDDGIVRMKEMLPRKKVLIVLDDVDDREQINNLAGDASWFGQGSRIIITTRNKQALKMEFETLEVAAMEPKEALRLFSMHAFDKDSPPKEYLKLSKEAIASTGRLPLALEVVGSHLRGIPCRDWAEIIKRLKKVPHDKVQKKLRISYEALDHGTKQMFLDIACFFIGYKKTFPMYMWDACEFDAKMGLRVLIHMSLVKNVVEKNIIYGKAVKMKRLWMHDQLRDLGREIVRVESSKNCVKRNRLWMHEDAFEVVQEEEGKKNIEMLRLCNPDMASTEHYKHYFSEEEFSGFHRLRYLECRRARITGDWSCLLPELRWLSCISCSVDMEFTCSSLKKLAVLDLSRCNISEDWSGWSQIGVGNKLKVLDLSYTYLRRTPDLSKFPSLERLILRDCVDLVEIDPSIDKLKGLKFLHVSGCKSLKSFPNELCSLNDLEVIILHHSGTNISELPQRVGQLVKLELLNLYWCQNMKKLPDLIGDMRSLVEVDLSFTRITELPATIGMLKRLETLFARGCASLEEIPSTIGGCTSLRVLNLNFCNSIDKLPNSVGDLRSLAELYLSFTGISELPDTVGNLEELRVLQMNASRIRKLPTSIGMLKRLEELLVCSCEFVTEVPSEIKGCTSLRLLDLTWTGVRRLPPKLPMSLINVRADWTSNPGEGASSS